MDHTIVSWDIPTHYNSLPSNSDHSHSRFIHWSHFSICVTATQNHFHSLLGYIRRSRVTYPSPPPYWKMKEPGEEKAKLRNYSWPHSPEEFWEGSLASDYWSFELYKTRLTNAEVFRIISSSNFHRHYIASSTSWWRILRGRGSWASTAGVGMRHSSIITPPPFPTKRSFCRSQGEVNWKC